ncbi:hypothetical protein GDO81_011312 [Engystomops pustulosus]|uniref:Secreted protein n=1 Tax=Engystomops pustulosus TaxID=76066 RepID=A0AAV7BDF8_ENGPU|nr:hypothetical protein GDO81_011312 [Engystomops pustulosus]
MGQSLILLIQVQHKFCPDCCVFAAARHWHVVEPLLLMVVLMLRMLCVCVCGVRRGEEQLHTSPGWRDAALCNVPVSACTPGCAYITRQLGGTPGRASLY